MKQFIQKIVDGHNLSVDESSQAMALIMEGVATPALVGDRLYVFSRENSNEVLRCLNAATGKELWQDKYPSLGASGPASRFSGPRSSPAVA